MNKAIQLWDWDHAPEEFRKLSTHGGDEDGVIFIPDGVAEPWWLDRVYLHYDDNATTTQVEGGAVIIWERS